MPSELSRQLDDFRTKNKVVPAVQKVSFLFDATRAAGLDILSLAIIARKSLLDLAEIEPSLAVFEDMFLGTDKNVDFLSQDEQIELRGKIKRLLSFLSAHFKTLDAQQCVEYLIQKYHIHVYNGEELILMMLPYHDSPLFGTMVKLIPFFKAIEKANASETRWMFLRNVHKSGSPLSRQALVKMCRSSQPVMTAIIDHAVDSLKHGAYNQPLMSFVNVLLLEVLAEFTLINFDISIPLFSLCRICFKAAAHCLSAFFVGLSLATHIVCVADVRDDALGILLSRAVASCPAGKSHSLLMALAVVATRRQGLPAAAVQGLERMDESQLESAVRECVGKFKADLTVLIDALASSPKLAERVSTLYTVSRTPAITPAVEPVPQVKASAVEESSDDDSSSDADMEEDELANARKVLTALVTKGSKKDRKAAVEKYASVAGATRHCIRLSAACDSVELLALTMRHAGSDSGFVPILISVIDQFSAAPSAVLEAAFGDLQKIPVNAITQVGEALNSPDAASLIALARDVESEFVLSAGVWKAMAAIAAGSTSQIGKSALITSWRAELLPAGFMSKWTESKEAIKSLSERFVLFANNPKVRRSDSKEGSVYGQLVCSLVIPGNATKQALTAFTQKSMNGLSVASRTALIAEVLTTGSGVVLKKLNELTFGDIDISDGELITAAVTLLTKSPSVEAWVLAKRLVEAGLPVEASEMISGVKAAPAGPIAIAAWRCVGAWTQASSVDAESVVEIVNLIASDLTVTAGQVSSQTCVMIETLLAIAAEVQSTHVLDASAGDLVKRLVVLAIQAESTVSDTVVLTIQSVCDTLLGGMEFTAAWTTVLQVMSELGKEHPSLALAVQVKALVLLSALIGSEQVDSETVTSKQLGQVLLGLVDLVSTSSITTTPTESWVGVAATPACLAALVEQLVTQFLLHCTLRKLDKFFRKLQQVAAEDKLPLVLRVYTAVCKAGGSAAALALLPLVSDDIVRAIKSGDSTSAKKRKRNMDVVSAGLAAVAASCVDELPEVNLGEFAEVVATVPGTVDDNTVVADTCIALARVGSTDQIKLFTKYIMARSTDAASPGVQEAVVKTVLALWRSVGEAMVPAITEVTVFLNELFNSSEPEVAAATKLLVKEIDRITGENIEAKLSRDD